MNTRIAGVDPSGSSLDRIAVCHAAAALPQIIEAGESKPRDKGIATHAFLERVAAVGREAALAEVDDEWRDRCADINIAKLADRLTLTTELAVAYNWVDDTARILKPIAPRAYEVDVDTEVPLTLDLAAYDQSADLVYSGDYKGPRAWLPEPEQSMQLGLGALALARIHGASGASVEYIRIRDDGTPRRFGAELDVFGLESAAERVRRTMGLVANMRNAVAAGVVPNVVEGPWCRYCPARQHCPAKTAAMRHVLGDPQPVPYVLPLTPQNAARAYELLKKAKDTIKQIEGAIFAYAKTTPIPLGTEPDGSERFFGEHRRPGNDVLDGAIVHQVMTRLYDGQAANESVTMDATKSAIGDAVRKRLPEGEALAPNVKKVIDEVRALHGITNPETCTTVEFAITPEGQAKNKKRKAS